MKYVFDIIMVAVLALSIFIGSKRGFIMTAFSLVAIVVAMVVANVCSPYVAEALEKTELYDTVYDKISVKVEEVCSDAVGDAVDLTCDEIVTKLQLPETVANYVSETAVRLTGTMDFSDNTDKISYIAATATLRIISYFLIAVATAAILIAIILCIKAVRLVPAIKRADNWWGGVAGTAIGLLLVYALCLGFYGDATFFGGDFARSVVSDSHIIAFIDKIGGFSVVF